MSVKLAVRVKVAKRIAQQRDAESVFEPPALSVDPPITAPAPVDGAAGYSIATTEVIPTMQSASPKIQRKESDDGSPAPAPTLAPPPDGSASNAEQLTAGATGTTNILAPTVSSKTYSGKTLQEVADSMPPEPGSLTFDIATKADGDPITKATVTVKQVMVLARWAERDKQCKPIQAAWDRFASALRTHEDEHVKINKQQLANAHDRYIGRAQDDTQTVSTELENETLAAGQTFDTNTDHGKTATPSTTIDVGVKCDDKNTSTTWGTEEEPVQMKLEVSEPGDPDEEEADRVAEQVMRMAEPGESPTIGVFDGAKVIKRCAACEAEEEKWNSSAQTAGGVKVRRKCAECEAGEKKEGGQGEGGQREEHERVFRKEDGPRIAAAGQAVAAARSGGQPLDPGTRAFMEPRFGFDFSRVRVHADSEADRGARSVNARAYTLGSDVVFGAGRYSPETREGQRLLAHELTHVVQQQRGTGGVQRIARGPNGAGPADAGAGPADAGAVAGSPAPITTPPVSGPTTPAPANKETDTGLVYITIPHWTVMDKKSKTIAPIAPWSTEVSLLKIPIPDFGTADLTFRAAFETHITGEVGPVVLTNLTVGMTKMTAFALGAGALFAGVSAPLGPGAMGPLLAAIKLGHVTGFGQLDAPAQVSAGVKASASLDAVLSLLGSQKLDVARTGFGIEGSLNAVLKGNAKGRTQVVLDDGHLRWKSLAVLSAEAGFGVNLKGYLHASILFGLLKARLDKQWTIGADWSVAAAKPIGDLSLDYDWPGFKDEDKVITVREETIRGVMKFVEDILKTKDTGPGTVTKEEIKDEDPAKPDTRTVEEKTAAVDKAAADAEIELSKPKATPLDVESKLPAIKRANRLTSIDLVGAEGNKYYVEAVINPKKTTPTHTLSPSPTKYPGSDLDPKDRTITQLWKDCSPTTNLPGESANDTRVRVEMAEATLRTKITNGAVVTAILDHDRGQSPRPFTSVEAEDALGLGGHITQRHVFGMGIVTDVEALAMRVLRHIPNYCPDKAGAFDSVGDANIAVSGGVKSGMSGVWEDVRMKLALGQAVQLTTSLTTRGTALVGQKVTTAQLPTYRGGQANVQLYPGDPKVPSPAIPTPLTQYEKCTEVFLRVLANPAAPGGWYINSAWPQ